MQPDKAGFLHRPSTAPFLAEALRRGAMHPRYFAREFVRANPELARRYEVLNRGPVEIPFVQLNARSSTPNFTVSSIDGDRFEYATIHTVGAANLEHVLAVTADELREDKRFNADVEAALRRACGDGHVAATSQGWEIPSKFFRKLGTRIDIANGTLARWGKVRFRSVEMGWAVTEVGRPRQVVEWVRCQGVDRVKPDEDDTRARASADLGFLVTRQDLRRAKSELDPARKRGRPRGT
jgi:hypothetical protein